ncbi:hypothetical protein TorRG33x02_195640 [Trema orientale]|uniref:Uncharacterized protein n=1 Tax=Trema orientale TaxID=63057 RepID=A0A2P5EGF5_TREOI|nr:hypothetical protein TorRG33x02_195640 [Trema orientale]
MFTRLNRTFSFYSWFHYLICLCLLGFPPPSSSFFFFLFFFIFDF